MNITHYSCVLSFFVFMPHARKDQFLVRHLPLPILFGDRDAGGTTIFDPEDSVVLPDIAGTLRTPSLATSCNVLAALELCPAG